MGPAYAYDLPSSALSFLPVHFGHRIIHGRGPNTDLRRLDRAHLFSCSVYDGLVFQYAR